METENKSTGIQKNKIPTEFPYLDKITGGLHPAELVVIAGRAWVGKTTLALNIARNIAIDSHIPVAYFSLEAPAVQIAKRLIKTESGIDIHKLNGAVAITQEESDDLDLLCSNLEKIPLYIDDTPCLKIEDFKDKVKRLVEDKGIKLAIVDYFELMTGPEGIRKIKDRKQEVQAILKSLKSTAKEFGIAVVAISQIPRNTGILRNDFVNKFIEYKCDYIVDLSDTIIFMENESQIVKRYAHPIPVDTDYTKIYVAKNGTVLQESTLLHFNPDRVCFQTPDSVKTVINLEWKITGPCPGQWDACFYNELDGRTYDVYLREDTYWWSASLFSAKGQYTVEEFERLPYEQLTDESIPLAFYYDTDIGNGPKIVEEAILYLQHRFPYLLFDSKIKEQYDFTVGLEDMDNDNRNELLERRAELMRRYLRKYEDFKKRNMKNSVNQ